MTGFPLVLTAAVAENMLDAAEPGQYIMATFAGRNWVHSVKLDRHGKPRTYCGVPITATSNKWAQRGYGRSDDISCGTCASAIGKAELGDAVREARGSASGATERPPNQRVACVAVFNGKSYPSRTGQHIPNVLKQDLLQKPVGDFCTWCGSSLDAQTTAPAPVLVPSQPSEL